MWEMIMSLLGDGGESSMINKYSGGSDAFKDAGDMTMGMDGGTSGLSTMDKLGQFGKDQFNQAMNPYTQGFGDISNIFDKLKNGQGLLNSDAGPTALSSMARLLSDKGLLGGDPNQMPQISITQPATSLGLPSANVAPANNSKLQPVVTALARQAYGSYF